MNSAEWQWPDRVGIALDEAFRRWYFRRALRLQRRAERRLDLAQIRADSARRRVRWARQRVQG